MRTVAIAAQKGGVGKTTTTVHLAAALARHGLRTLVVDLDPQAHATALLVPREQHSGRGTANVLLGGAGIREVVSKTPHRVDVCAATRELAGAELALASEVGREGLLRQALREVQGNWDVCLLDCPPSLGLLTANALVAADAVLSPVLPSYLSILAVKEFETSIAKVRSRLNGSLEPLGYLLCAVDARERLADDAREALRAQVGKALWALEVRVDARLKAAPGASRAKGRGADDYDAVADELRRRLKLKRATTQNQDAH